MIAFIPVNCWIICSIQAITRRRLRWRTTKSSRYWFTASLKREFTPGNRASVLSCSKMQAAFMVSISRRMRGSEAGTRRSRRRVAMVSSSRPVWFEMLGVCLCLEEVGRKQGMLTLVHEPSGTVW